MINRAKAGNGDAQIASYQDYYPFGAIMPGKSFYAGDKYRYDFQGQQKDEETGFNSFMLRDHSAWLGRWLTPDPMREYWSNYVSMGNNPASLIDPTGGCVTCNEEGEVIYDEESGRWGRVNETGNGTAIDWMSDAETDAYFATLGRDIWEMENDSRMAHRFGCTR